MKGFFFAVKESVWLCSSVVEVPQLAPGKYGLKSRRSPNFFSGLFSVSCLNCGSYFRLVFIRRCKEIYFMKKPWYWICYKSSPICKKRKNMSSGTLAFSQRALRCCFQETVWKTPWHSLGISPPKYRSQTWRGWRRSQNLKECWQTVACIFLSEEKNVKKIDQYGRW